MKNQELYQVIDKLYKETGAFKRVADCLDVAKNPGLREGIKQYTNWPTIPQLFVDGEFIGGADIVESMEANGELAAVLNS